MIVSESELVAAVARPEQRIDADLAELAELLRTAHCAPCGELIQRRDQPQLKTYFGSGKVDELEEAITATDAEVLVIDDDLTPSQQRYLENRFSLRVIDRTALILDIFAAHAHTAEGKLQVELAQLEYQLPRMRGMWQHLERLGGGVATVRQYLQAGLLDALHLAVSPVLLGKGEALFQGLDLRALGYECERTVAGERATHVLLRKRA